jgi:pimeloyl-ACP methyl ester carboxylesterase
MASKEIYYKNRLFNISYDIINPTQNRSIVVLHGWGSNKEIMKRSFAKELKEYRHIYIDLPGFGKSSSGMVLQSSDYASIVELFLGQINSRVEIAMGHSFGGKVATLLGTPYLVLLSSSGILVPKPLSIRLKIALFKALKPIGIQRLRGLFVSSDAKRMSYEMYETFKNIVDEEFEHNFSQSQSKTLLFWGKSDTATPLYTAEKISTLIKDNQLYPLDGDHFFFVNHREFISKTILDTFKETTK